MVEIASIIALSLILIGGIKGYSKSWTVKELIQEKKEMEQKKDL